MSDAPAPPRLIAWELTRACPLACRHCRASAQAEADSNELTPDEARQVLEKLAAWAKPLLILTGGEPMLREDLWDLVPRARELGLPVALAPCGMLVDEAAARRMVEAGIRMISLSLDGPTAEAHDAFRGVEGAFDGVMRAVDAARAAGLPFQVNTTVTRANAASLPQMLALARRLGAACFNPFLLVPTGRGKALAAQELSAEAYEEALRFLAEAEKQADVPIRVTCAPHYQRVRVEAGLEPVKPGSAGCLGGKSFAFISHTGVVQICGFLDVACGALREADYDFRRVWEGSEVLRRVRNVDSYGGACGVCEYRRVCGGCRARAFAATGDYLAEEPLCGYVPRAEAAAGDRALLAALQARLPIEREPFAALAEHLGRETKAVLETVRSLVTDGTVRRIGPVFNSGRLGYRSTLVAARVEQDRLDIVAAAVSARPGVTHNYAREGGPYTLWFTLTAPSREALEAELAAIASETGVELHPAPALTRYKIRAVFGEAEPPPPVPLDKGNVLVAALTDDERALVRAVQDGLAPAAAPFDAVAEAVGRPMDWVLGTLRGWLADGTVRRFGAVVRHRRLGYTANGMAAFAVPDERIDAAGTHLAARADVTHCYHRPALPDFPYTLYTMLHGSDESGVRALAAELAAEVGAADHAVLFSTREYKKASMRYFVEDPT